MVSGNIARWIKGDFPPFLAYWGRERLPLLSAVYQNAPYCPRSAVLSLSICLSTSRVSTLANRTDEHCGINILQSIKSISGRSKSMAITWQRAMWNQTKPTKTWWFVWTPGFFLRVFLCGHLWNPCTALYIQLFTGGINLILQLWGSLQSNVFND